MRESQRIARDGLLGVGLPGSDRTDEGSGRGIFHIQRLLSTEERLKFAIGEPRDIRGTPEEIEIIDRVFTEAPYLRPMFS